MNDTLSWPIDACLVHATNTSHSWAFTFSNGVSITTEAAWRLITPTGIAVTSEDHGQKFGLGAPIDAAAVVLSATKGQPVLQCQIAPHTSDLRLQFRDQCSLEFLNLSSGFEGWMMSLGNEAVICQGGGRLHQQRVH